MCQKHYENCKTEFTVVNNNLSINGKIKIVYKKSEINTFLELMCNTIDTATPTLNRLNKELKDMRMET